VLLVLAAAWWIGGGPAEPPEHMPGDVLTVSPRGVVYRVAEVRYVSLRGRSGYWDYSYRRQRPE